MVFTHRWVGNIRRGFIRKSVDSPAPPLRVGTDETDGTSFATAITSNDFFTFTLSPASGYRFVFQSFSIDLFDSANNADNYTAFDNLTANATLQAIPEPGTVALVSLGAAFAGTVILRRRKR